MNNKSKPLIFTGGHHTSALEVAKQLKKEGWDIIWYGHRHSMWGDKSDSAEYREVTTAGITFYDLKAGKFHHTFNPFKLIRIPLGFIQAFFWLTLHKPVGIVSFGGYLAVPTVIAGWLLGIPSITHEQTVIVGWANKTISLFVKKIALAWPSSLSLYPSKKAVVIGLPIRQEILNLIGHTASQKNLIYITGGKQGSHVINKIIFSSLSQLASKYRIIHQTGASTIYNDYQKALLISNPNYSCFDFDTLKSISALKNADVVVSRAGAHTIYELGLLGKRSVLIPIPWVSHKEQEKNAMMLVNNNQAILLPESKLNTQTLLNSIQEAQKLSSQSLNLPINSTSNFIELIKLTFKL